MDPDYVPDDDSSTTSSDDDSEYNNKQSLKVMAREFALEEDQVLELAYLDMMRVSRQLDMLEDWLGLSMNLRLRIMYYVLDRNQDNILVTEQELAGPFIQHYRLAQQLNPF